MLFTFKLFYTKDTYHNIDSLKSKHRHIRVRFYGWFLTSVPEEAKKSLSCSHNHGGR